jgi:hypothetical protein
MSPDGPVAVFPDEGSTATTIKTRETIKNSASARVSKPCTDAIS